jgi:methylthioribulose-1-phosphate dehydratase
MTTAHHATERAATALAEITADFSRRGWFPGTSGNLSTRVSAQDEPLLLVVSASSRDKASMTAADFLLVDGSLRPVEPGSVRPSSETVVHARIYEATGCGCVLHVHTVWNNLIAEWFSSEGEVALRDLEMLKGLDIWEEAAEIRVPIVENLFHLPALADALVARITDRRVPGVLIRHHGLYAWGENPFEAKRHVEAFEFMWEYLCRLSACDAQAGQGNIVGG